MPYPRIAHLVSLLPVVMLGLLACPPSRVAAEEETAPVRSPSIPEPFSFRDGSTASADKDASIQEWLGRQPQATWDRACDFVCRTWEDQWHYYCWDNLVCLAAGVAVAAPFANTNADLAFRDWYQERARSPATNRVAAEGQRWGDHFFVIPIYLGAAFVGGMFDDTGVGSAAHEWGTRTLRALVAGAPSVGVLQYGLGASRPGEASSRWRPFHDTNSVAGHGFVGAVPFLTAAAMTENRWLRGAFFAASFATDFARINDDDHYLSQAILGWWIAYLAVRSVDATERESERVRFFPTGPAGGAGVTVQVDF